MLGSGINPESFKQDYSGFARAAEIQAQGLQNLGQSIGGAIQNYGEAKKEQRKVDAYNKASAKSIEAAITLGDSYGIKGARETLSPFLSAANDPNLSPIEKAALLDEAKAMIPNVFGRFDKSEAIRIEQAAMNARSAGGDRTVNLQQGEVIETINGKQYKIPVTFDPVSGVRIRPDGTIVGMPMSAAGASPAAGISSALNLPARPVAGGLQSQANAINNAAALPTSGIYTDDTSQLPPLNTGVANEGSVLLPVEGTQPDLSTPVAPALGNAPATPVDTTSPGTASVPSYAIPLEEDKVETFRPATAEESVLYGGVPGQMSSKGRFYPITPPPGFIMETNSQGGIKFTQGAGVGGDLNKAPTTQIKEGEAIVPDATSPTGTRIVQIPSEAKEKAKTDFSGYMQQITGSYASLDAKGKAVTGEKSSIMNALTATGAGQAVSRALGSEDQVLRDQINTMRPNIVNVIRQATEMGAKGMDSEKELTFYLSAIGDPSLPVEANIKALETLDKVYGTGKAVNEMLKNFPDLKKKVDKYSFKSMPTSTTPTSGGTGLTPEAKEVQEKLRKKLTPR